MLYFLLFYGLGGGRDPVYTWEGETKSFNVERKHLEQTSSCLLEQPCLQVEGKMQDHCQEADEL